MLWNLGNHNNVIYIIDYCSRPQSSNMKITNQSEEFRHGLIIKVDCNEGYVLNGTSTGTIACDNGKWKPQNVDCKFKPNY